MTPDATGPCRDMLGRISRYLDGELDQVECRDIEEHCRGCAPCAALVDGLRETIGLCQEAGRAPLPEAVRRRAQDAVSRLLRGR
jgi:anti-sigma factor RsiW